MKERCRTGLRNATAEETRRSWDQYYAQLIGDADLTEEFRSEFGRYVGTHTWENSIRVILKYSDLRDGDKVLEAGCGWGRMLVGVVRERRSLDVTGVDISKDALAVGRKVLGTDAATSRISWIHGDLEEMPLPDEQFDVVYSARVFQHLPNPSVGARELLRVLKPGGRFVVFLQNRLCPLNKKYYARLYSPSEVRGWFQNVEVEALHVRSMDFVPSMLSRSISRRVRMRMESALEVVPGLNMLGGKVLAWGHK